MKRPSASQSVAAGSPANPRLVAPAIDYTVIARMFGDDRAAVERLLATFVSEGGKLVAEIAAAAGDARRLADNAHKLKGAARTSGAARLGDLAAALEQSGDRAAIAPLIEEWRRLCGEFAARPAGC